MKKFEYDTLMIDTKGLLGGKVDDDSLKQKLNQMGQNGWELISTTSSNRDHGSTRNLICIFKREIH